MKTWDLNSGSAQLELAMKSLRLALREVKTEWDDEAIRKFEERYLHPLQPRVVRTLDSVHRLSEVLARAEHEIGSY